MNGDTTKERITQVGSKIKVKWTAEEVKGSGWKAGWYTATVHRYDQDSDILTHIRAKTLLMKRS